MEHLSPLLQKNLDKMASTGKLFVSEVSGRDLWDLYLKSFLPGEDPQFRDPESSTHNCNHCKNFIRRYGNIVAVDSNNNIITLFDVDTTREYQSSMDAMDSKLKSSKIKGVFRETFSELNSLPYESCSRSNKVFRLGFAKNTKRYTQRDIDDYPQAPIKVGETRTFHHFHLDMPKQFVDMSGSSRESIVGKLKTNKEVYKRLLTEVKVDAYETVLELIEQGSLLNGTTYINSVKSALKEKKEFDKSTSSLTDLQKDNYIWVKSLESKNVSFRNSIMGKVVCKISDGEDLERVWLEYNTWADPTRFMKAKAPLTKAQKEKDAKLVSDLGYLESFNRRLVTIEDINLEEIKHVNSEDGSKTKEASIFDSIQTAAPKANPVNLDNIKGAPEVSIETFMSEILPNCTSIKVFLANSLENNMVTLTTSVDPKSKLPFKWDNPFSYTYKNNLAGKSGIKTAVKSLGGKVEGASRFSIMWSEGNSKDNSDLDAHCKEPNGTLISYSNKKSRKTGGELDVDIQDPSAYKRVGKEIVENIIHPDLGKMTDGKYLYSVENFSNENSEGFTAEIEILGNSYSYVYNTPLANKEKVDVAYVIKKGNDLSIQHLIPCEEVSSREIYGLESNNFHKVNLVCLSPNHWGENNVGHKHYLFMLEGAVCDENIRTFHSENLNSELYEARKTLERLGSATKIDPKDYPKHLSGVGFNSTMKEEVVVKLEGYSKSLVKVKF